MLTNDDLKILSKTIEYLSMLRGSKAMYFCEELDKIYYKVVDEKNKRNEKSKKYNKEHKKYHNLINAMYYNRKRGNWARVREIEEEIKNFKNLTSK